MLILCTITLLDNCLGEGLFDTQAKIGSLEDIQSYSKQPLGSILGYGN